MIRIIWRIFAVIFTVIIMAIFDHHSIDEIYDAYFHPELEPNKNDK